jgi:hypothetical protein
MTTGTKASREANVFELGLKHKYLNFRRTKIVAIIYTGPMQSFLACLSFSGE